MSVRPPPDTVRPQNRLLAALPDGDFNRLLPHLKTIPVRVRQYFHRAGEPIRDVYFPNGGVFSVATVLPDGATVEALPVGSEGMFCIEAFLRDDATAAGDTLMQVGDPSPAIQLGVVPFRRELALRGALHELMGRYAHAVFAQTVQNVACNVRHRVQQRCARWLLQSHDRTGGRNFHLSHEYLAVMLGVHRPTVTIAAGALQQKGLISYRHGNVRVLDREGLEAAACDCYAVVRGHFDAMGF